MTRQQTQTTEQDQRLHMLNTLLTTPHRDLTSVFPVHQNMVSTDPLFYARLGAWYADNGEIRDHKEMFVISLALSNFEGHRDVGLALLREMPPYQVARVVDFVAGKVEKKVDRPATPVRGRGRRVATPAPTRREVRTGLFRCVPRSMTTEITRYLREREADDDWFDSCAIGSRKAMKRLYGLLHVRPSDRAQAILFDEEPPEGSRVAVVKALRSALTPAEQAKAIMDHKIPYRIASTVINQMTPSVLLALVEVMSDQELINNLGSLKRRGAMNNPEIKEVISKRLETAKTSKRVAALKSVEAAKAAGVDEEMAQQLADIADTQVKSRGRIIRPTALLVDKSSSMHNAIEIGKRMAAMISAIMDADFYCYAFDSMPYPIQSSGTDLGSWEKAFRGISAGGCTGCGCSLAAMARSSQRVEQIFMITDEGENEPPAFLKAYQDYCEKMAVQPSVFILQTGSTNSFGNILDKLQRAGVEVEAYRFDGDYYSLPNLIPYLTKANRLDLLMEIMTYPLPERKSA